MRLGERLPCFAECARCGRRARAECARCALLVCEACADGDGCAACREERVLAELARLRVERRRRRSGQTAVGAALALAVVSAAGALTTAARRALAPMAGAAGVVEGLRAIPVQLVAAPTGGAPVRLAADAAPRRAWVGEGLAPLEVAIGAAPANAHRAWRALLFATRHRLEQPSARRARGDPASELDATLGSPSARRARGDLAPAARGGDGIARRRGR